MRAGITGMILVLTLSARAAEQPSTKAGDDSVGQSVADAARAVGHATRDVAREVGHATRDVAKETGKAAAKGAKHAKKAVSSDAGKDKDKDGKKASDNPAGKTR